MEGGQEPSDRLASDGPKRGPPVHLATEQEFVAIEVVESLWCRGVQRSPLVVRDRRAATEADPPTGSADALDEIDLFKVVEIGLVEQPGDQQRVGAEE